MANNIKVLNLFNGTLTTASSSLYTPSTSVKSALITSIQLSSSASPTVTIEVTGGGATSLIIDRRTLGAAPVLLTDVYSIGAGEKLEIWANANANVQFAVMGIERD